MTDLTRAPMPALPPTELLVCATCRRADDPDGLRAGPALLAALADLPLPEGLRITPVDCLQNCGAGCTVALRGAGRWTYVFGQIDPATDATMLLAGAAQYHATPDGLIPWRDRPEHFKRACVARIPPLTAAEA